MKTLTQTQRFVPATEIPAEAEAFAYVVTKNEDGIEKTQVAFKATDRAAKMAFTKASKSEFVECGWKHIDNNARNHGTFAW